LFVKYRLDVKYETPSTWGTRNDNVIANGQIISITPMFVHELHFLYAGDASGGEFGKSFTLNFDDNSTQVLQCEFEI